MNTKKAFFLFSNIFILCVFSTYAYGAPGRPRADNTSNLENIKFGLQASGLFARRIGGYVEYKFTQGLGIQSGLYYYSDLYGLDLNQGPNTLDITIVTPKYITLPLILRTYPGADRQFCLFIGMRGGYLVGGKEWRTNQSSGFFHFDPFGQEQPHAPELKESYDVNPWELSVVTGFDYETSIGLIFGLAYSQGRINVINEAKDSYLNWTFQPSIGYNLARLF